MRNEFQFVLFMEQSFFCLRFLEIQSQRWKSANILLSTKSAASTNVDIHLREFTSGRRVLKRTGDLFLIRPLGYQRCERSHNPNLKDVGALEQRVSIVARLCEGRRDGKEPRRSR